MRALYMIKKNTKFIHVEEFEFYQNISKIVLNILNETKGDQSYINLGCILACYKSINQSVNFTAATMTNLEKISEYYI